MHQLRWVKSQLAVLRMPYIGESNSIDPKDVYLFWNSFTDPYLQSAIQSYPMRTRLRQNTKGNLITDGKLLPKICLLTGESGEPDHCNNKEYIYWKDFVLVFIIWRYLQLFCMHDLPNRLCSFGFGVSSFVWIRVCKEVKNIPSF